MEFACCFSTWNCCCCWWDEDSCGQDKKSEIHSFEEYWVLIWFWWENIELRWIDIEKARANLKSFYEMLRIELQKRDDWVVVEGLEARVSIVAVRSWWVGEEAVKSLQVIKHNQVHEIYDNELRSCGIKKVKKNNGLRRYSSDSFDWWDTLQQCCT